MTSEIGVKLKWGNHILFSECKWVEILSHWSTRYRLQIVTTAPPKFVVNKVSTWQKRLNHYNGNKAHTNSKGKCILI